LNRKLNVLGAGLLALCALGLFVAAGCKGQQGGGDVMARVNGRKILRTEIEKYYRNQTEGQQPPSNEQAQALRLGILRTAHIYPKDQRATRDLARKRMQLVRSRTQHVLAVENIVARETAVSIKSNDVTRTHFAHGQAFRHRDVGFLAHPGRSWWTFPINDMISHALTLASPEIRLSALVLAHHDIDSQRHQQCDHEVAGVVPVCDYDIALFEVVRKSPHECCLAA